METINIQVVADKENKLVQRREISATAQYQGKTPSRDEVKQQICKQLNLPPESSAVVAINQIYGTMSSTIVLHSYKSKEAMEATEPQPKAKAAKPGAPAEAPAAAPAAPAKAAEKK